MSAPGGFGTVTAASPLARVSSGGIESSLGDTINELRPAYSGSSVVRLSHENVDLFAKLEFTNPTGSSKDRSAFWMLRRAIARGEISTTRPIVESSSGNFAVALASLCRALGLEFIPVIDANTNTSTESFLRRACDRVEKISEPDSGGGFLQNRLRRLDDLRADLGGFWPNQYGNRDALDAHYTLTAGEIVDQFDSLDYVFVGVGTGGTISGVSNRLKEDFPGVTVVAVDSVGSVIFGGRPRRRHIPGLGSSIVPDLVRQAIIDDVVMVEESDTVDACHELVRHHGVFGGGSTGTVYHAVNQYFRHHRPTRRPRVLFLCADRGTAYTDTVYDSGWVHDHFDQTDTARGFR
ncbi:2,3-diaminopropionate biosynthesis protein SbnA [Rhodococcus sp. 1168]|uniref:2,3-diaminopropionate biosynthesis protein SbnA n=1 Tax=Rhodococcus sp. 1168 TaxID=2018041 RepID=UPI001C3916BB|nr:2,3-diaminopropionate biosynthesis protein SbnA [Rhodococcus sp. 1168]